MRFVPFATLLVLVGVSSGCVFFSRPNPRIEKIGLSTSDRDYVRTFTYDDAGRPLKAEVKDDEPKEALELEWDDGSLVAMTFQGYNLETETEYKTETKVEYEGDRLVRFEVDSSGIEGKGEVAYDDAGRIVKVTIDTDDLGNDATVRYTQSAEYDDHGDLVALGADQKRTVGGNVDQGQTYEHKRSFDRRDGRIVGIKDEVDGFGLGIRDNAFYVRYDDEGRVEKIRDGAEYYEYEYDDDTGLLSRLSHWEGEEGPYSGTNIYYDEGEASDVEMGPLAATWFGIFDLKGGNRPGPDAKTFAPRMIMPSW